MRVAGIGCRKGVAMAEVIAAVEAAFAALCASPLRGEEVDAENVAPKTPSPTRFAGHLSPASGGEEWAHCIAAGDSSPPLWGRGASRMRGGAGVTRRKNIRYREEMPNESETVTGSDVSHERFGAYVLDALATSEGKALEPAIIEAARALGLPLIPVAQADLKHVSARCLTRSEASLAATGIASLSEAAALAAVGEKGRLLGPRIAEGNVTCAIAQNRDKT